MPKAQGKESIKKTKSTKNIYFEKINSLIRIVGDRHVSLPCMGKVRNNISSESFQERMLIKKENNKNAARMVRQRKKIYMELLEQTIQNMQRLNEESKVLEKASAEMLQSIKQEKEIKYEEEIGQYFMEMGEDKVQKETSKTTINCEAIQEINRITYEIENFIFPSDWSAHKLQECLQSTDNKALLSKLRAVLQSLPEIFLDIKAICSDHTSLNVLSFNSMLKTHVDPYIYKTLLEEFFSKTLCRKDLSKVEVEKHLNMLIHLDSHCLKVQHLN